MTRTLAAALAVTSLMMTPVRGGEPLPRSTPEAQGIASGAIVDFVQAADRDIDSLHSVMVVRHGHVVAEGWWTPYNARSRHEFYSLSKSFTSTAVGLAVGEGKLSVSDTVLSFFPDEAPASPSDPLKAMRVADLLRMSTGHQTEPQVLASEHWKRTFLAHPVLFKPGTHFLYNTAATYMCSAIVQKATGQTVLEYLKPRLFEPLGIDDPTWPSSPEGVTLGGYGLSARTEDIAKFGQLYLQRGQWKGRQLVPAEWVDAATRLQTSNGSNPASDWDQGYGYQFWRCRNNAFRGDGAFGQYCLVLPDQDAVVAITSGLGNMQAVLDLVWSKILPGMHGSPLPEDAKSQASLREKLAGLTLRLPEGKTTAPAADRAIGRTYAFDSGEAQPLESIRLDLGEKPGEVVLVTKIAGAEHRIPCGSGRWVNGTAPYGLLGMQALAARTRENPAADRPVAASSAWADDDTLALRLAYYETPYVVTLKLSFPEAGGAESAVLDAATNVSFGPSKQAQRIGHVRK